MTPSQAITLKRLNQIDQDIQQMGIPDPMDPKENEEFDAKVLSIRNELSAITDPLFKSRVLGLIEDCDNYLS